MLQAANKQENTVQFSGTDHVEIAKPVYFFLERYADAYRIEQERFVEALKNKTTPPTTADDGLKALALADAALKSYETGLPVDL